MSKYGVTHPGPAHRDDFIAACLIMAWDPGVRTIYRRDPTQEEIDNPDVYVFDIGGVHDKEKNCYDHHQFDREADATCAASLFIDDNITEKYPNFRSINPWVEHMEILDSKGPGEIMRHYGLSPSGFAASFSPVESYYIKQFGSMSTVGPVNVSILAAEMRKIGKAMIHEAESYQAAYDTLIPRITEFAVTYSPEPIPGTNGVKSKVIHGISLPREPEIMNHISFVPRICNAWRQDQEDPGKYVISIAPDERGVGYTLFRYADDPRVNFSQIGGNPKVLFAHKAGFVAKTKEPLKSPELLRLCAAAIVEE